MTCGNDFPANSENIYGSTTVLILIVVSKSCVFIFSFLFTGENGKTIMKPVYPLCRKKKIGKSKIDIDFQFLILNWKLNGRMTHGPERPPLERVRDIKLGKDIAAGAVFMLGNFWFKTDNTWELFTVTSLKSIPCFATHITSDVTNDISFDGGEGWLDWRLSGVFLSDFQSGLSSSVKEGYPLNLIVKTGTVQSSSVSVPRLVEIGLGVVRHLNAS